MILSRLGLVILGCAVLAAPAYGIVVGQVDDFEDGGVAGWGGGTPGANLPAGGPAGASDNYLQFTIVSDHLGFRNEDQWLGDWLAAGVNLVEADFRNVGDTTLSMRLMLLGAGDPYTSTTAISVPADGLWHHVVFPINSVDLTNVGSQTQALDVTLGNVVRVLIRNDPGAPSGPGGGSTSVNTLFGVDNIRAVPEPAGLGLLVLAAAFARRRR